MYQQVIGAAQGELARDMAATLDNGIIVCGYTQSFSGPSLTDGFLMKLDQDGVVQWQRVYGSGILREDLYGVIATSDGGFAAIGATNSFSTAESPELLIIRTDPSGDLIWSRTFPVVYQEVGYELVETAGGGFVFAGEAWNGADYSLYVAKIDAAGGLVWAKNYNTPWLETPRGGILLTNDGGYLINGGAITSATSVQGFTLKLDAAGNIQWWNGIGAVSDVDTRVYDAIKTANDGYLLCGSQYNGSDYDGFLLQLDAAGSQVWAKKYPGVPLYAIETDPADKVSGVIMTGAGPGTVAADLVGIRADLNGNVIWSNSYGAVTAEEESGVAVGVNSDGTYSFAGHILDAWTAPTYDDVFVVRTDALGATGGCEQSLALSPQSFSLADTALAGVVDTAFANGYDRTLPELGALSVTVLCSFSTATLPELGAMVTFALVPNPAHADVHLQFESRHPISHTPSIRILDAQGRDVTGAVPCTSRSNGRQAEFHFSCEHLSKGVYAVLLSADGRLLGAERLVVE